MTRTITSRDVARRASSANRCAVLGAAAFALVAIRLAWMSDDGAITARVIANFLTGYGPNYNITERAQAFTHPLWFLLNTALSTLTGEILITMLLVGTMCAAGALYLVLRGRHWVTCVVVTLAAISTYALTEYAASGLENPLSWLLLAVMWHSARGMRPLWAGAAAGLLMITRLDLALVAIPFMALWMTRRPLRQAVRLRTAAALLLPVLAWTTFSWLYYGSPLPETAYAKLNTSIPQRELLGQGIRYAVDLSVHDTLAALLIIIGLAVAWNGRVPFESTLLVGACVVLYGGYVIVIGGDFMSGRFWTVPLFAAVVALSDAIDAVAHREAARASTSGAVAVLLSLAVFMPLMLAPQVGLPAFRDPFSPQPRGTVDLFAQDGIVDEWTYYVTRERTHGFLQWVTQDPFDTSFGRMRTAIQQWQPDQTVDRVHVLCTGLGYEALFSGPTVHWAVPCGLSDPFLARVEFEAADQNWRIGHFERPVPPGYVEALQSGSPEHLPLEFQQLFRDASLPRRISDRWAESMAP